MAVLKEKLKLVNLELKNLSAEIEEKKENLGILTGQMEALQEWKEKKDTAYFSTISEYTVVSFEEIEHTFSNAYVCKKGWCDVVKWKKGKFGYHLKTSDGKVNEEVKEYLANLYKVSPDSISGLVLQDGSGDTVSFDGDKGYMYTNYKSKFVLQKKISEQKIIFDTKKCDMTIKKCQEEINKTNKEIISLEQKQKDLILEKEKYIDLIDSSGTDNPLLAQIKELIHKKSTEVFLVYLKDKYIKDFIIDKKIELLKYSIEVGELEIQNLIFDASVSQIEEGVVSLGESGEI